MDAAKAAVRGTFIVIQAYLKKQETAQINNITIQHWKELEKEETKSQISRRMERIKIEVKINQRLKTQNQEKEQKSFFSEEFRSTFQAMGMQLFLCWHCSDDHAIDLELKALELGETRVFLLFQWPV